MCVWVFEREKKMCREVGQLVNSRGEKKLYPPIYGVSRAIYSPRRVFQGGGPWKVTGLKGPQNEWVLILLERS